MSSLPVPVSPRMSTVESIRATDQARGTPGPRQLSCKACRAVHIQNPPRNRCFEKKPASVREDWADIPPQTQTAREVPPPDASRANGKIPCQLPPPFPG